MHPLLITEKIVNNAKPLEATSVLTKIKQALCSESIAEIIIQLNLFEKNELNLANLNEFDNILKSNRVDKVEIFPMLRARASDLMNKSKTVEIFPMLTARASDLMNKSKTKDAAILLATPLLAAGIGAGVGALVGSFIPIVGTIFGAIVGAALGGAFGVAIDGWQGFIRNRVFGGKHPTIERVSSGALSTIGLAGIGALLGTFVFPGFGTLLGGALGGSVGLLSSLMIGATRWIQSRRHHKIAPEPETETTNTDPMSALRRDSTPRSSQDKLVKDGERPPKQPQTVIDSVEENNHTTLHP